MGQITEVAFAISVAILTHVGGVHLVILRTDGERFHLDLVEAIPTLPVFKVTGHLELALALHLVVDLVIREAKRAGHGLGPRLQATDHLRIQILHHDACISRIVVALRRLQRIELRQRLGREELRFQCSRSFEVGLRACRHVGDHQAAQMLLIVQRIFHRQDAAPRVAIQNKMIQTQSATNLLDFGEITGEGPECRIVRYIGVTDTKLVIVVHLDPGLG